MKSRIKSSDNAVVLIYGFDEEKFSLLRNITDSFNIKIRFVNENEKNLTVGTLLKNFSEIKNFSDTSVMSCMVMSGLDSKTMDKFLSSIRKNNIDIPLKAVVTPHNIKWNFNDLTDELLKEHNAMKSL